MEISLLIAVLIGLLQGIFEWLPISSEGNIAIVLAALGTSPSIAVSYALFLHLGTAISATIYYRQEVKEVLGSASEWRQENWFNEDTATLSFIAVAMATSSVIGVIALLGLEAIVSELTGGAFVALIGLLLIGTGLLQRFAGRLSLGVRASPDMGDAIIVGAVQGLAILPGISRSGTTTSALLLRGHDGPSSFQLSFLLSIPAAIIGGAVGVVESGGITEIGVLGGIVALLVAGVVGYITIGALMRVVRRVAFWIICLIFGSLAFVGGMLTTMV